MWMNKRLVWLEKTASAFGNVPMLVWVFALMTIGPLLLALFAYCAFAP